MYHLFFLSTRLVSNETQFERIKIGFASFRARIDVNHLPLHYSMILLLHFQ